MFSNSMDSKMNKIKMSVDSYLNNDKKKDQIAPQPMPSVRRPDQLTNVPLPSLQPQPSISSVNPNIGVVSSSAPPRPNDIEIKQLIFQNKTYDKPPITLKNILKEKSITIFYNDDQTKYKLQIKAVDNGLELKINQQKGSVDIHFKKAVKYKFFKQETGEPKWMLTTQIKQDKISIITSKDAKMLKNYFEGVVPQQFIKIESGDMKMDDRSVAGEAMDRQDVQDADDIINFAMPTPQQLGDTQKFRKAIKDMKEDEKMMILMDIYKIKKEYDDNQSLDRKKLKCPIHACQKTYREISQLKTHLKKHPELNKHGIEFTEFGTFEYNNKAMDLALYLGKLYPFEMKKIIKKMKTKQNIQ